MTTLKSKEIKKMSRDERQKRLKELKMELIKSKINASKNKGPRAREIRKIIARILTIDKVNTTENKSGELKNK